MERNERNEYRDDFQIREDIKNTHRLWKTQRPVGTIDGTNRIFQVPEKFMAETLTVFVNGLRVEEGVDYFVVDDKSFRFTEAPAGGSKIIVDYIPFD